MNSDYRAILQIMKSAMTRQPETLPEGFRLEDQLELLKMHHMFPLIYDGALRCGISRKEPFMQKLFGLYIRAIQKSDGQLRQIDRICEAFRQADIDYLPLKGVRMKKLYPAPELRYMGDADILIRLEQYEKIVPILEELDFSFQKESDHELVWRHEQLLLELHKHLIPSYNKDFYGYYGNGWQLAVKGEGSEYTMRPEDEWIFLFTHFAKHYRDGGAGCRYVADLWLWRENNPQMDEDYILDVLKKMQLDVFYGHILRLIDCWFGNGPEDKILEVMTEFIFSSGSWGVDEIKVLSRAVRDARHSALGFSGRLLYLWQTTFPKVTILQDKYTVLKKHPWLLPLVWIYRPFYKVFFEWKSLGRKKKHLQTLSEENMQLRRDMLHLVGMEYNT
jgi:hypothetical protein